MRKNVLLASFIRRETLDESLEILRKTNKVLNNRVFILRDSSNKDKLILTYNILLDDNKVDFSKFLKDTISLHRKKETNTLYSLNCLNLIVEQETGKADINESHVVNWTKYPNCVLLAKKDKSINIIKTQLEKIITL